MHRPELTIAEAAKAAAVSDKTIRRRLNGGKFPNAHRLDPSDETSPWRIPVADLSAAGFKVDAPSPPDPVPVVDTSEEVVQLREEVTGLRHRLELTERDKATAERIAETEAKRADAADRALLMLTEGSAKPPSTGPWLYVAAALLIAALVVTVVLLAVR